MTTKRPSWPRRVYDAVLDFFVGDDWFIALGAILVVGTAYFVGKAMASWWILAFGIPGILAVSLCRATHTKP